MPVPSCWLRAGEMTDYCYLELHLWPVTAETGHLTNQKSNYPKCNQLATDLSSWSETVISTPHDLMDNKGEKRAYFVCKTVLTTLQMPTEFTFPYGWAAVKSQLPYLFFPRTNQQQNSMSSPQVIHWTPPVAWGYNLPSAKEAWQKCEREKAENKSFPFSCL